MSTDNVIEFAVAAIWLVVILALPVLLAGLFAGVVVGTLQALTQVQDQSIALITRILIMLIVLGLVSPWMIGKLVEFSKQMFMLTG